MAGHRRSSSDWLRNRRMVLTSASPPATWRAIQSTSIGTPTGASTVMWLFCGARREAPASLSRLPEYQGDRLEQDCEILHQRPSAYIIPFNSQLVLDRDLVMPIDLPRPGNPLRNSKPKQKLLFHPGQLASQNWPRAHKTHFTAHYV